MIKVFDIGGYVKNRMLNDGIHLREAAKHSGVSPATLSRTIRGGRPDLLVFQKLVLWLELDRDIVNSLVYGYAK